MTTLKQDAEALAAKAAAIGVDATVTTACAQLITAIQGAAGNVMNDAYIAATPEVKALLDKAKAIA